MKATDIIVLANKERYILLEEVPYEGRRYFVAASIDEEENIDRNKIVVLGESIKDDGTYVEIIRDEELITTIIVLYKKNATK